MAGGKCGAPVPGSASGMSCSQSEGHLNERVTHLVIVGDIALTWLDGDEAATASDATRFAERGVGKNASCIEKIVVSLGGQDAISIGARYKHEAPNDCKHWLFPRWVSHGIGICGGCADVVPEHRFKFAG